MERYRCHNYAGRISATRDALLKQRHITTPARNTLHAAHHNQKRSTHSSESQHAYPTPPHIAHTNTNATLTTRACNSTVRCTSQHQHTTHHSRLLNSAISTRRRSLITMELLPADASTRDVYLLCSTHSELLRHTAHPAVQRVAHALRSFKNRHKHLYPTPALAFPAHWQFVLSQYALATPAPASPPPPPPPPPRLCSPTPTPSPCSSTVTIDLAPPAAEGQLPSNDDIQCLLCYQATATIRLLPCGHDVFCGSCAAKETATRVKQHRARRIRLPNLDEEAVLIPCPVCRSPALSCEDKAGVATLQQRVDTLEATVRELRGLISQHRTPEKLESRIISRSLLPRLRVLSIVGDGRCLLYTLLQSRHAMLPVASEADALRRQLRAQLDAMTDEAWERRVPQHMRDILSRAEFAHRYLHPDRLTAHVPIDCIALWQDITPDAPDVYILTQAWVHDKSKAQPVKREHVEVVRASRPASSWMMVQLSWHGAGHFQLITLDDIITIPLSQPFVKAPVVFELDRLCAEHLDDIRGRKAARRHDVGAGRIKRRKTDEDEVVD